MKVLTGFLLQKQGGVVCRQTAAHVRLLGKTCGEIVHKGLLGFDLCEPVVAAVDDELCQEAYRKSGNYVQE